MSGYTTINIAMAEPTDSAPAEPPAAVPMCDCCLLNPIMANGLGPFVNWCKDCEGLMRPPKINKDDRQSIAGEPGDAIATVSMCSKCHCRPTHPNSMFDDWCAECDLEQRASQEYVERCVRAGLPRPPLHPVRHGDLICPCGFFAIRNKPLARPRQGKDNWPLHQLVTVPLSDTAHIVMCLICEQTFRHHRKALKHVRTHHAHFHAHHGK